MSTADFHTADHWKLRTRSLAAGKLPLLMGVINVTPDSFSDGGCYCDADAAVEHGLRLAAEGADILNVGGESTRPGSEPVDAETEISRVLPVVEALARKTDAPISIDTSKASVAQRAIDAGAEIINDVTALAGDADMLPLAAETGAGVCIMHAQGLPRVMQDNPVYADVVADILEYLRARRDALLAAGLERERIAVDPGIGFGKTAEHNLQLLSNAWRFHSLDCPVLIGHSRKCFLDQIPTGYPRTSCGAGVSPAPCSRDGRATTKHDRTPGTIGVALSLARRRVQILRIHDVAAVRQALLAFEAAGGLERFRAIAPPCRKG